MAREVAASLGWEQIIKEFEFRLESIAGIKPSTVPAPVKLAKRPKARMFVLVAA